MAKSKWGAGLEEVPASHIGPGDVVQQVVDSTVFEVRRIREGRDGRLIIIGVGIKIKLWPHTYLWRYKNWDAKHTLAERLKRSATEKRKHARLIERALVTGR